MCACARGVCVCVDNGDYFDYCFQRKNIVIPSGIPLVLFPSWLTRPGGWCKSKLTCLPVVAKQNWRMHQITHYNTQKTQNISLVWCVLVCLCIRGVCVCVNDEDCFYYCSQRNNNIITHELVGLVGDKRSSVHCVNVSARSRYTTKFACLLSVCYFYHQPEK